MSGSFYLVWCPTGATTPRHRHSTFDSAKREAERLAECAPKAEFFVLAAVCRSQKVTVQTEMLANLDLEIPF